MAGPLSVVKVIEWGESRLALPSGSPFSGGD